MEKISELEVWQRGPIDGVPALLQPVAHALLQAVEDVDKEISAFPLELLWKKPGGVASVGFHLKHLKGVVDRLFTYARGEMLNDAQTHALKEEPFAGEADSVQLLADKFRDQVATAIDQLKTIDVNTLTEKRRVGRKQVPSTVIGLLFHSAEHIQRHVGQLIVTARILKAFS
ncbi:MAG TPA: DinB family protein [Chryseolinea sp.]|nr:DinB family protein [Chryseolinea sp.]